MSAGTIAICLLPLFTLCVGVIIGQWCENPKVGALAFGFLCVFIVFIAGACLATLFP